MPNAGKHSAKTSRSSCTRCSALTTMTVLTARHHSAASDAPGCWLVAAQGGTAVHNAGLYRTCRRMVESLYAGLESRAVIEQAKGILHAELEVSPAEAFGLLSRYSQNTNQRVRKISAALVQGRIAATRFRPPADPSV
jgi:ANTAR domain